MPRTDPVEAAVEVDAAITTEDWVDFALHNGRGYYGPRRLRGLLVGLSTLFGAFAIGGVIGWASGEGPPPSFRDLLTDVPVGAVPALFCLGLLIVLVIGRYVFYDRLLRRRHRRWAIREHGSAPLRFQCRLDASGYTVVDANGQAHRNWSSLARLEETDRQFFLIARTGHGAPIPKRGMSTADQDRLRAFVLARLPGQTGLPDPDIPALPLDASAEAAVVARYEQTPQDRAAATLLLWNTRARRRRRALAVAGMAAGLAAAMLLIDASSWWLLWRERHAGGPFVPAFLAFARTEVAGFGPQAAYAAGLGAVLWVAMPWLLRRQAMAMARPRGVVPVQIAFGETGVSLAAPGTTSRCGWTDVVGVLEDSGHIGVRLPLSMTLPVPKRALSEAELVTLRALLAEHVGRR